MEPSGVTDSHRILVLATAFFLAACSRPGATTPAATPATTATAPGPTATASTEPAPSPRATAGPALFHLVGNVPVIGHAIVPDRGAVLPGAVAVADGEYHAWVVTFGNGPSAHDLRHLTSPDAITWTVAVDPSLEALGDGLADPGAIPTSIVRGDGEWVMYFRGAPASDRQAGEVWRATAPSLGGPWSTDGVAVVERGPAGSWDSGGLDFPSVVRLGDGYVLLYSGVDFAHPEAGSLGLATSADGIAWTKHGEPVVAPGLCGAHDARAVQQPRLVLLDDRLFLAYAGYAGALDSSASVGLAESTDGGATWTCAWPASAVDTSGLTPGYGIHTVAAFARGDRLALLVEWLANNVSDDWLAEAEPGAP
jgi:hypothetical protein